MSTVTTAAMVSEPIINSVTVAARLGYNHKVHTGSGGTLTADTGILIGALTGATSIGVDIATLAGATTNLSLRSSGTAVELRHAGPAMFGINAAPTTTAGNILELERTHTITGTVADGQAAGLVLDPGYTAATAQTVTRHNYVKYENVSVAGAGPAAVTDAAIAWFDAAVGTHKATASNGSVAVTITSVGPTGAQTTIQGWIKVNMNGTIRYIPFW
jgi:hypothetical protein